MSDFNLHRTDEPIYLAPLHKGETEVVHHMRRPRSSKGYSYCGLRLQHNDARRLGLEIARDPAIVCRNCLRAFFGETFPIYCEKSVPEIWVELWRAAQHVEKVYDGPQEDAQDTIRPVRDSLAGHARNGLQIAQLAIETGTAELGPAEVFELVVSIRDRLQCVVDRVQLLEDTLDGYDVSELPAYQAARTIRRIIS